MELNQLIQTLARHGEILGHAFADLPEEEARWRPAPGKWSALEILGHLLDEERGDFRVRIGLTLEDPRAPWPSIDPEDWVRERAHNERELPTLLGEFRAERSASLAWLSGLQGPAWDNAHQHAEMGPLRAGDLLAAWVAHDAAHLSQLATTRVAWVQKVVEPYSTRYSGW